MPWRNKVKFWLIGPTTQTCYHPELLLLSLIGINSCVHSRDEYRVDNPL